MKERGFIRFITDMPALLLPGREMVITDLHLGAEYEFRRAGISMPSQTGKLLEKTIALVRQNKAKKLVILGDIKHKVPGISFQEEREIPHFLNKLNDVVGVEIVPGNHDGGIRGLVPDIPFHPSTGFRAGDFYLAHGHTWPSAEMLNARYVLIGHNHPTIEFKDGLGYSWRERVWVRTELNRNGLETRYGKIKTKIPELIIMPAYNHIVGGRSINNRDNNAEFMGPLGRTVYTRKAKAYLLDGTLLGDLEKT